MKKSVKILLSAFMAASCLLTGCGKEMTVEEFAAKAEKVQKDDYNFKAKSVDGHVLTLSSLDDPSDKEDVPVNTYTDIVSYDFSTQYVEITTDPGFGVQGQKIEIYTLPIEGNEFESYASNDGSTWIHQKMEYNPDELGMVMYSNSEKNPFMSLSSIEKGKLSYNKEDDTYVITVSFLDMFESEEKCDNYLKIAMKEFSDYLDLLMSSFSGSSKAGDFINKFIENSKSLEVRFTFDKDYHLIKVESDKFEFNVGTLIISGETINMDYSYQCNVTFIERDSVQLSEATPSDTIINSAIEG